MVVHVDVEAPAEELASALAYGEPTTYRFRGPVLKAK
jgi:hypothetical protein